MDESLKEKLRSLGVNIGAGNLPSPIKKNTSFPIEDVITGEYINTSFGLAFRTEARFAIDYQHGDIKLEKSSSFLEICRWANLPLNVTPDLERLIFLDTETSGLAGGTGTFAFMIGLGFFEAGVFKVIQLFMREPAEEEALLALLSREVFGFDALVTFNGKSFDIPLLNDRHVLNRISSPFPTMGHIDLLPLARRIWRSRLPSRALKDLEQEILHFARTQDEVPGWMIPEIYYEFLRTSDARPLGGVFYHNMMDIVSLAALFRICSAWISRPLETEIPGLDLVAIGKIYEDLGLIDQSLEIYQAAMLKNDLTKTGFFDLIHHYASIFRKRNDWLHAASLWHEAGDLGDLLSLIELAKYYEHKTGDYSNAIKTVLQCLSVLETNTQLESWQKENLKADLNHRLGRLQGKMAKSNA